MTIHYVSTQSELNAAIKVVGNGDTILLAPGAYDKIDMGTNKWRDHDFEQKVVITSADPENPAVVNELLLNNASNIDIKDINFDYIKDKTSNRPFLVDKSEHITFDNITFHGHLEAGYGAGFGLRLKGSSDITVVNSDFYDFNTAIDASNSEDIKIVDNNVRGLSNDGFTFGGIDGALIAGNDFRGYNAKDPYSTHKDHIQFRAGGEEAASQNILIRDNVFVDNEVRQGIFLGNEAYRAGDTTSVYRNITVQDNYLETGHLHGISVFYANGVEISGNYITPNAGVGKSGDVYVPLINVSKYSTDVEIVENVAPSVPSAQNETWTVWGNVVGGRRYKHWDGTADMTSAAAGETLASEDGPRPDVVVIDGADVVGATTYVVPSLDFDADDVLILTGFDAGIFTGSSGGNTLAIWEDGGAVEIDSALDLQELSDLSQAVTGWTQDDTLHLRVTHSSGVAEIVLEGLGYDWHAANLAELF